MFFIWLLIIVYIIFIIRKNKQEREQEAKDIERLTRNNYNSRPATNNSYYSSNKVASYKKMEQDHDNHEDVNDISSSIGYKTCPNCSATVSKKSTTCFMCNYEFDKTDKQ